MTVKMAAPSVVRMLVRSPALLRRNSRSAPMTPPSAAARIRRSMTSRSGMGIAMVQSARFVRGTSIATSEQQLRDSGGRMLWTIVVLLLVLWLLGFSMHVAGGLIHILLVIALVVIVLRLLTGRRV